MFLTNLSLRIIEIIHFLEFLVSSQINEYFYLDSIIL